MQLCNNHQNSGNFFVYSIRLPGVPTFRHLTLLLRPPCWVPHYRLGQQRLSGSLADLGAHATQGEPWKVAGLPQLPARLLLPSGATRHSRHAPASGMRQWQHRWQPHLVGIGGTREVEGGGGVAAWQQKGGWTVGEKVEAKKSGYRAREGKSGGTHAAATVSPQL